MILPALKGQLPNQPPVLNIGITVHRSCTISCVLQNLISPPTHTVVKRILSTHAMHSKAITDFPLYTLLHCMYTHAKNELMVE